jgi:FMN reductase
MDTGKDAAGRDPDGRMLGPSHPRRANPFVAPDEVEHREERAAAVAVRQRMLPPEAGPANAASATADPRAPSKHPGIDTDDRLRDDVEVTEHLSIVGLGGSLSQTSRSLAALQVALDGAAQAGASTRLLNLRDLDLPMYNPDDEREPPPAAATLIEACYSADGMLWSSPMYQGTVSGAFKNALDWLHVLGSREPPFLHDQVIGLISAAGGTQGLQAINTMEFSVRALRGWAVPYVIPVAAAFRVFDQDGQITDANVELQLRTLGAEVVRVAARFADHATPQRARDCEESAERVAAAAV